MVLGPKCQRSLRSSQGLTVPLSRPWYLFHGYCNSNGRWRAGYCQKQRTQTPFMPSYVRAWTGKGGLRHLGVSERLAWHMIHANGLAQTRRLRVRSYNHGGGHTPNPPRRDISQQRGFTWRGRVMPTWLALVSAGDGVRREDVRRRTPGVSQGEVACAE